MGTRSRQKALELNNKIKGEVKIMPKFELSFMDAMREVLNGKYVQGEKFAKNVYLKVKDGIVIICTYCNNKTLKYLENEKLFITNGVLSQKYRIVTVLNEAGLAHSLR